MNSPAVSIVIPFYNAGGQLERAVRSVFGQSFVNWELILVDDGSNDDSREIAAELIDGESKAKLIVQDNRGVSAARNRGTEEASAPLVTFLDSDDNWMPDFLQNCLDLREQYNHCALWGCRSLIDNGRAKHVPRVNGLPGSGNGVLSEFFETYGGFPAFSTGASVIDKKELVSCGGFPEGVRWGEDCDTWIRLALTNKFATCNYQGLVINMEPGNRASLSSEKRTYRLLGPETEKAYVERLDNKGRADSLIEYMNWFRLVAAADCLRLGQKETARQMLQLASGTLKFNSRLQSLRIKSRIPAPIMKAAVRLRAFF